MTTITQALHEHSGADKRVTVRMRDQERRWVSALAKMLDCSEAEVIRQSIKQARLIYSRQQLGAEGVFLY